jgi:type IV secretory pathway VirB10-like protein
MKESNNANNHIPQVAAASPLKKRLGLILFGFIILGLLISVLHGQKKSPLPKTSTTKSYLNTMQSDLSSHEAKNQLQQLHETIDLEKIAQAEKFYRLRQNAPIEMYQAKNNSSVSTETSVANLPNNQLPLTASQIEKLKNYANTDSNSQFAEQVSNKSIINTEAKFLTHPAFTVPQGTLISGVLQTAINSDLPGMVKANVSQDIYAMQGSRILIPKGSTLIGEYNSDITLSQRRVFILWTRLMRPDGIEVQLNSSGIDAIGQAGLNADALDTHFWARFSQASLLSILSSSLASNNTNADSINTAASYRLALANSFQQAANNSLLNTINIKPTLHIHQGDAISVFVNRDLSFYDVLSTRENS